MVLASKLKLMVGSAYFAIMEVKDGGVTADPIFFSRL